MIEQRALTEHMLAMQKHYGLTANDRVLQFASTSFDASLEQILPTLISGGSIVLRGPDIWTTAGFTQNLKRYELTVVNPPTAYWHQLVEEWARIAELAPGWLAAVGDHRRRNDAGKKPESVAADPAACGALLHQCLRPNGGDHHRDLL